MIKYLVLFNPLAGSGTKALELPGRFPDDKFRFRDVTTLGHSPLSALEPGEEIIVSGGDGTLNRFANDIDSVPERVWYHASGSGNDFRRELGGDSGLVEISGYLRSLPTVKVGDTERKFINGIGYGIDGYCCEVGDRMRGTTDEPINYSSIAIKGLLFHYRPTSAEITVDGVTRSFRDVWLAPTMYGRFYGGGMMPTPGQERGSTVSVMVFHGKGRAATLAIFPGIFNGSHVKHSERVSVLTGREISVEFDRPTPLQIDGETISGVTGYSVRAPLAAGNPLKNAE